MKRKTLGFRRAAAAALIGAFLLSVAANAHEQDTLVVNPSSSHLTKEEVHEMVEKVSGQFYQNEDLKEELNSEIRLTKEVVPTYAYPEEEREFYILTHEGKNMRFFMEKKGDPGDNGKYPLFITLHGGGGGPAEGNNDQWIDMFHYYKGAVDNGIYVACRGITDTWDLHFQEDSYPLYDRLIEAMVVNYGADPDRVYLLGFSAGGEGVYQIAPRLADRFAAVNMSSGHPNGVRLLNLANCPISLQAGIRDYYTEDVIRSVRAAEFEKTLSDYREKYGFGYEHMVCIHVPAGHNYTDYEDEMSEVLKDPADFADRAVPENVLDQFLDVQENCGLGRDVSELSYYQVGEHKELDNGIMEIVKKTLNLETEEINTNAVRYVSGFTRNAVPEKIVWDLSTRASKREKDSFYWLEAGPSVDRGIITASFDAASNTITVEPDENVNGDFAILFHPDLIDVSRPVTIKTGDITRTVQINPSEEFLKESMLENGDPKLACVGKIMYSTIVSK